MKITSYTYYSILYLHIEFSQIRQTVLDRPHRSRTNIVTEVAALGSLPSAVQMMEYRLPRRGRAVRNRNSRVKASVKKVDLLFNLNLLFFTEFVGNSEFLCEVCGKRVESNSIQCNVCQSLIHRRCSGICGRC